MIGPVIPDLGWTRALYEWKIKSNEESSISGTGGCKDGLRAEINHFMVKPDETGGFLGHYYRKF